MDERRFPFNELESLQEYNLTSVITIIHKYLVSSGPDVYDPVLLTVPLSLPLPG